MSKRYVESPLAPHEQARAVENVNAHGRPAVDAETRALIRKAYQSRSYITGGGRAGSVVRVTVASDTSRARSANGVGAKQNARRNGRLMGRLTETHALSGLPTAPVESVERALVRWRDPTFTDGVKVSGSRKGKSRDGKVYRKP